MLQPSVRELYVTVIEKTLEESRREVERKHGVGDGTTDEEPASRQAADVQLVALNALRDRWTAAINTELDRMDSVAATARSDAAPQVQASRVGRPNGGASASDASMAAAALAAAQNADAPSADMKIVPQGDGVGEEDREPKRQKVESTVNDLDDEDLGSGDDEDVSDLSDEDQECDNYILAQHEKVKRSARWKVTLKDGVVHVNDKDLVFSKMNCEFTW